MKTAGPWSVMAAYNKLNGTHCTENRYLLKDLARDKWGYRGIFVSDWGAVHDPAVSVKNGLNLQMPGGHRGIAVGHGGLAALRKPRVQAHTHWRLLVESPYQAVKALLAHRSSCLCHECCR